ncbi:phosphotriesterase family protein [Klebsiella quasipneumoniae]|uniref:phosphotriesterase family protein n=2 Tax=Klebsiella/Raoultella group TaxID=2890311 RepID=UPI002DBB8F50|nr:transposase [Klebsiella quasipneumoniae]
MIRVVGIDIAKSVFHVCVWMVDGSVTWNKKISRSKLLDTIRQFEPGTLVAMEACATSHFWGRTFASMGYCVRLIPAQHVKAFVRNQKNDANDALAICETAFRPGMHFVSVKTIEQQDIKALRNTRQLMVQETADAVSKLIELGYGDQLVLSHDVFLKQMWAKNGGNGWGFVPNVFLGYLSSRGVDAESVKKLCVDNPANLLA